jgi:hypothetical protein
MGMGHTAPRRAVQLAERAQFVKDHPGWTFQDYDNAAAGDIAFMREYEKMLHSAEQAAIDAVKDANTA